MRLDWAAARGQMNHASTSAKWFLASLVLAICVGPTFISYKAYIFEQDDADYLYRAIAVSHAWWSGQQGLARLHEIVGLMVGIRPPAMTMLGIPWGSISSWGGTGRCFISLDLVISFLVALCVFLLARIGVKPILLVLAGICAFAALGPLFHRGVINGFASGFMADSLFAWTILAALLLIPLEARSDHLLLRDGFLRGVFGGVILSLGTMTKISFLYFVMLIVPTLLTIVFRRRGLTGVLAAFAGLCLSSAPSAAYLLKFGRPALTNGAQSSFGQTATLYNESLLAFFGSNVNDSTGLAIAFVLVVAGIAIAIFRERERIRLADILPPLILSGFEIIVLNSVNRDIRYTFPAIVAFPFLVALLLSAQTKPIPRRIAASAAAVVFCSLAVAALPTRHRAEREASLGRADAAIAHALSCSHSHILLGTDTGTLNHPLLHLASAVTPAASRIEIDSLAYDAVNGIPFSEDTRQIQDADEVILQDEPAPNAPVFSNQRVPEYRHYISGLPEFSPVKVWRDVTIYSKVCHLPTDIAVRHPN